MLLLKVCALTKWHWIMADMRFLAPNAEYATETREELLYNKEKLLSNGMCATLFLYHSSVPLDDLNSQQYFWFEFDSDKFLAFIFVARNLSLSTSR